MLKIIFLYFSVTLSCYAQIMNENLVLDKITHPKLLVNASHNFKSNLGDIRARSIHDVAETIAIQSGVKWRYEKILKEVETIRKDMDRIFNINPFLIHNQKVIPPIIEEAKGVYTLNSKKEVQESKRTYVIRQDAELIITTPSWEKYLYHDFFVNSDINPALVPKDSKEQLIWDNAIKSGWEIGVKQADREFSINLNKLTSDIKGMILFHKLALQKVVSVPILAKGKFGITIDGKTMDVDHRVFRLTTDSSFNKTSKWVMAVGK